MRVRAYGRSPIPRTALVSNDRKLRFVGHVVSHTDPALAILPCQHLRRIAIAIPVGQSETPFIFSWKIAARSPFEIVVLAMRYSLLAGDLARNLRRRASRRLSRLAYCAPQEKARRVETAGF